MAVVRLRGLPFSATSDDVARFFTTLPVGRESVTLVVSGNGKHNGDAFVWIHKEDVQAALKYHRKNMGSRYVEVFESNMAEYKAAVHTMGFEITSDAVEKDTKAEPLLLVRGFSHHTSSGDLVRLFASYDRYEITERDIYMCLTTRGPNSGLPCGQAYVRFPSGELATEARTRMRKVTLERRELELLPATKAEMEARAANGGISRFGDNQGEGKSSSSTSCGIGKTVGANKNANAAAQINRPHSAWLRLRDLPYACTAQNVVDFVASAVSISKNVRAYVVLIYGATVAQKRIDGVYSRKVVTISPSSNKNRRACIAVTARPTTTELTLSSSGLPDGEAFIQLRSRELADDVRNKLHGKVLGSRTIDVSLSSHAESIGARTGPYDRPQSSYRGYNDQLYENSACLSSPQGNDSGHAVVHDTYGGNFKAVGNNGTQSSLQRNDGSHFMTHGKDDSRPIEHGNEGSRSLVYGNDGGHSTAHGGEDSLSMAHGNHGDHSILRTTNDHEQAHNSFAAFGNASEFDTYLTPSEAAARHSLWAQSA